MQYEGSWPWSQKITPLPFLCHVNKFQAQRFHFFKIPAQHFVLGAHGSLLQWTKILCKRQASHHRINKQRGGVSDNHGSFPFNNHNFEFQSNYTTKERNIWRNRWKILKNFEVMVVINVKHCSKLHLTNCLTWPPNKTGIDVASCRAIDTARE